MKIEAIKDGKGNIVISENSFEMLLACLDNQKFIHEAPQNGDSIADGEERYKQTQESVQATIDEFNRACRDVLHQKYVIETTGDNYFLSKRYDSQVGKIAWNELDVKDINNSFQMSQIKYTLIERPLRFDNMYLTISDDGEINRPWTAEEIEKIKNILTK